MGHRGRRSEEDLRRVLKAHSGELAAGVYARDCPGFDEWLQQCRQDLASPYRWSSLFPAGRPQPGPS